MGFGAADATYFTGGFESAIALGPDRLAAAGEIPDLIVALTSSPNRLGEYAGDERHARFISDELVPNLERTLPLEARPQSRCLMGASFGAVASLTTALARSGSYGRVLLQSGSFAFTDIGDRNARGPLASPPSRRCWGHLPPVDALFRNPTSGRARLGDRCLGRNAPRVIVLHTPQSRKI